VLGAIFRNGEARGNEIRSRPGLTLTVTLWRCLSRSGWRLSMAGKEQIERFPPQGRSVRCVIEQETFGGASGDEKSFSATLGSEPHRQGRRPRGQRGTESLRGRTITRFALR
jgi:hypothetical protein